MTDQRPCRDASRRRGERRSTIKKRKSRKKVDKRAVIWVAAMVILFVLIACAAFTIVIMLSAPRLDTMDVEPDGYRSTVVDKDGDAILTLSGQESNRIYVQLVYIPADVQHAFVAIEDERFYEHSGIDLRGIARAIWTGIRTGNFSEGASTITQQLLKNNVFTEWTEEKTFLDKVVRKLQEQYLAVQLERQVSKDWILENYLNTINLGGGNWGVQTASRYYFHKDVSDLTVSEAAVLAGIAKAPTTYNPVKNPEKNADRRRWVLKKMRDQGYITEDEYQEALADDVYTRIQEIKRSGQGSAEIFSYFEDALIYSILEDLKKIGYSEGEAWNLIYRGGLTICATVDSDLQTIAEEEINNPNNYDSDAQATCVIIDNETGEVRALVGGRGEKTASLVYNRALSSVRQPGSTIKILGEYAAGIDSGVITLGTVFDDAPYSYTNGTSIRNSGETYSGRIPVRQAIVESSNVVALKCFQEVGMNEVLEQIGDFGITTLTEKDEVEALAIGGTHGGVCNFEMTAAYSALARGGIYLEPVYYTRVLDKDGKVLLKSRAHTHEVVTPSTAKLLTDAMEDVMAYGTGGEAWFPNMGLAGKSGTTTNIRDAWFIGYSPYMTCGIWGGFDDNSAQESSTFVKVLWKAIMARGHAGLAEKHFSNTDGLVRCTICSKCGKLAVEGLCDATLQGDMTRTEYYTSGTQPIGHCNCHVSVDVCNTSGMRANSYCSSVSRKVYLREGSEDTPDEDFVLPDYLLDSAESCTTHRSTWDTWFNREEEEDDDDHGSWWEWWNWGSPSEEEQTPTPTPTPWPYVDDHDPPGGDSQDGGDSWWSQLFPW